MTLAAMTDIHDIRPPVPLDMDIAWWAVLLIIIAAALALAALWWGWRKFFGRRPEVEVIVPELPPEMIALSALDALASDRLNENQMTGKAFYFRLSAILRQYMEGRYGVGAPEMTTEEFLPHLDALPLDPDLSRSLRQLCRAMDRVKFGDPERSGGDISAENQMTADLDLVRCLVHQTAPAPPSDALADTLAPDEKGV